MKTWSTSEALLLLAYLDYCEKSGPGIERFKENVVEFLKPRMKSFGGLNLASVQNKLKGLWQRRHLSSSKTSADVYTQGIRVLDLDRAQPFSDGSSISNDDVREARLKIEKQLAKTARAAKAGRSTTQVAASVQAAVRETALPASAQAHVAPVPIKRKASSSEDDTTKHKKMHVSPLSPASGALFLPEPPHEDVLDSPSRQLHSDQQQETTSEFFQIGVASQVAGDATCYQGPAATGDSNRLHRPSVAIRQATQPEVIDAISSSAPLTKGRTNRDLEEQISQLKTQLQAHETQAEQLHKVKQQQAAQNEAHHAALGLLRTHFDRSIAQLCERIDRQDHYQARVSLEQDNAKLRDMVGRMQRATPYVLDENQIRAAGEPMRVMQGLQQILSDIGQIIDLDNEGIEPAIIESPSMPDEVWQLIEFSLFGGQKYNRVEMLPFLLRDVTIKDILCQIIAAYLVQVVFESQWPEPGPQDTTPANVKLDKVYDVLAFQQGGNGLLKAVDSVAQKLKLTDPLFNKLTLPSRASKLTEDLCRLLRSIGSTLEDISSQPGGTAVSLRGLILRSLQLKTSVMSGFDAYHIFFPPPNHPFKADLMSASSDRGKGIVNGTANEGAKVGFCMLPGLLHKLLQPTATIEDFGVARRPRLEYGGFEMRPAFRGIEGESHMCIKAEVTLHS